MKKFSFIMLFALIFIILYGYGTSNQKFIEPTPTASKPMINPGDKVGDFLITTAEDEEIFYITKTHCAYVNETRTEFCELPVGTKVNVGLGIYEDNVAGGNSIDEYWSGQTHNMYIEGYPVNLEAFGTVEFTTRKEGRVRLWNVVILSEKAGIVSAQSVGVVGGNPFDYTAVVTFTDQ